MERICLGKVRPEKGVDYFTSEDITQLLQMIAPELLVDNEYKTAERWGGKTVYTALIDCGVCEETPKVIATQIAAEHIIRHCGHIGGTSLPAFTETDAGVIAYINAYVMDGFIHISVYNETAFAGMIAQIRVWYTKPEEE